MNIVVASHGHEEKSDENIFNWFIFITCLNTYEAPGSLFKSTFAPLTVSESILGVF